MAPESLDEVGDDFDVVIVGAGPAGAAAACSLLGQKPQLRVLLIDKAAFPRDKCCGDGLGPGVVDIVHRLGLTGVFDGEVALTGCTVLGPGGVHIDGDLPPIDGRAVAGYVVPRTIFDTRIVDNALRRGAQVRRGRFLDCDVRGMRPVVRWQSENEIHEVTCSLLVGADGANSRVRKSLGIARNGDRGLGIALRAYVDVKGGPDIRRLLFEFSEELLPAYAWFFPGAGSTANVGLGVLVRDYKRKNLDLEEMLGRFMLMMRARGFLLSEPRLVRTYLLPFATPLPRLVHERAVLIGDAGSMINPLSGEGIFYGMAAGESLGALLAEPLSSGRSLNPALHEFERTFRRRFAAHYRSNAIAQWLLRSPWWGRVMIRAASRDKKVLASAVQLLFGEGVIKLSTTGRILGRGLRRGD